MKKNQLSIFLLLFSLPSLHAQMVVTEHPPAFLFNLEDIFSEGEVEVIDIEFLGASTAVGYFENGLNAIGIDRGFVLTSGRAKSLSGSSAVFGADARGIDFAWRDNGLNEVDADMITISNTPYPYIYDPSILQMTFIPHDSQLTIEYVFGSEEYPEWVGSDFNDAFGIFVSGPGINGPFENNAENIAIIPGTSTPVSINTINHLTPQFSSFYHNNDDSLSQPVYDGFLSVFQATFTVIPYETYTLKLAVTDIGDHVFDSAIFLNTQESNPQNSPILSSLTQPEEVFYEGSDSLQIEFDFSAFDNEHFPFSHHISGTAKMNEDFQLLGLPSEVPQSDPQLSLTFVVEEDDVVEGPEYIKLDFISAKGTLFTYYLDLLEALEMNLVQTDTAACAFDDFPIEVAFSFQPDTYSFSSSTLYEITPYSKVIQSPIVVEGLPFNSIFDPGLIQSVCVNIDHYSLNQLELYLMSPDGKTLELSTNNGGNCDDYVNTCFSTTATDTITGINQGNCLPLVQAQSTGTFLPEGDWNSLKDARSNGTWNLLVWDDQDLIEGELLNWTITFSDSALYRFEYSWSNGDTTPAISVSPAQTTSYSVTVFDGVYQRIDSVTLTVNGLPTTTLIQESCPGDCVIAPDGNLICTPGTYSFSFPSASGCDSLVTLDYSFFPTLQTNLFDTICTGECITGPDGLAVCSPGIYNYILTGAAGCDSVVVLAVEQLQPGQSMQQRSACPGECIYLPDMTQVCTPGTYQTILTAANGCDSIVITEFMFLPTAQEEWNNTICPGDCITGPDGTLLCEQGDYDFLLTSWQGCDSMITIHLSELQNEETLVSEEICAGTCFEAPDGTLLCQEGEYQYHFTAANGCDSLLVINLSFLPQDSTHQDVSICPGECYSFNNSLLCTPGMYPFVLANSHGCDSAVLVTVSFRETWDLEAVSYDCLPDCSAYTLSFDISLPGSYDVLPPGGSWNGNTYTSLPILNGDSVMLVIRDENECYETSLNTQYACDCIPYAGTMDTMQIDVCGNGKAVINHLGDEELFSGDVLCFMLHLGDYQPVVTASLPEFSFDPALMSYETIYRTSAIAGYDDGSGCADLSDPQLAVSDGPLVIFHEIPDVTISGDTSVCAGDEFSLDLNFSGPGPWSFVWEENGNMIPYTDAGQNPFAISGIASEDIYFSLSGLSNAGCENTSVVSHALQAIPVPAVTVAGNVTICPGSPWDLQLEFSGQPPFSFSLFDGQQTTDLISGNISYSIAVQPLQYTFYQVVELTDAGGCPGEVSGQATVDVFPPPEAQVQSMFTRCVGEDLQVVAAGGNAFSWLGPMGFAGDGPILHLEDIGLDQAGLYWVMVTDSCGQTDSALTEVHVNCLNLTDTLSVGASDTLCFDGILQSVSTCDDPDPNAIFWLDSNNQCLIIQGQSEGIDTVCLEILIGTDTLDLSLELVVNGPLSTATHDDHASLNVFPNPASGYFYLQNQDPRIRTFEIFNVFGKRTGTFQLGTGTQEFFVPELTPGWYLLRFETPEGSIVRNLIIH